MSHLNIQSSQKNSIDFVCNLDNLIVKFINKGLYKPPNISIDIFNENLEVILNTIGKERKNAFLIGDYNINTLDELSCNSKQRQDFINLMTSYSNNKLIGFLPE